MTEPHRDNLDIFYSRGTGKFSQPRYEPCPRRSVPLLDADDPTWYWTASCDAYQCLVCGPRKVRREADVAAWAVRHAQRARFVTFTLAPDDHRHRTQRMNDLAKAVRNKGYCWQHAWVAEYKHDQFHIHCLQHGDVVPLPLLKARWGHRVDVRPVTASTAFTVASYMLKVARIDHDHLMSFLDLNGGKQLLHTSSGFFHGLSKPDAINAMRTERYGPRRRGRVFAVSRLHLVS